MKRLNKIEQYIKRELKDTMKELNLKSIPVYFNSENRICFRSYPNKDVKSIRIDSMTLMLKCTTKYMNPILYKRYKLDSVNKRFKFILYHELGHYIQARKYPMWFNKYRDDRFKMIDNYYHKKIDRQKAYRDLKLEHTADKLAISIYNRKQLITI